MEIVSWMAAALTLKAAEPARPMVIPDDIELACSSFLRALTTYNQGVIEANAAISALKGSDDFIGQSSASAETIHLKWEALKKRDDAHFGPLCKKWGAAQRRRAEIVSERNAKQNNLRDRKSDGYGKRVSTRVDLG